MSGKTLAQMNRRELLRECAFREINGPTAKSDMLAVLENALRAEGLDPFKTVLPQRQPLENEIIETERDETATARLQHGGPSITAELPVNLTLNDAESPTMSEITQVPDREAIPPNASSVDYMYTVRSIAHATEEMGAVRRNLRDMSLNTRMEARLSEVERALSRITQEIRSRSHTIISRDTNGDPQNPFPTEQTTREHHRQRNVHILRVCRNPAA